MCPKDFFWETQVPINPRLSEKEDREAPPPLISTKFSHKFQFIEHISQTLGQVWCDLLYVFFLLASGRGKC